ncbi:hypothetical protein [Caballeronia humi]|nr:hypothetical protein [Caballeronia humi]
MDDRFDRRELLLHLGDMLEAMNCLANTQCPNASVAQLTKDEKSLQRFAFLRGVAPTMSAAEFAQRATRAYSLWPKELLEQELNHDALATSVQHALFEGDPGGWEAFAMQIQEKVKWFGTGLPEIKADVTPEDIQAAPETETPVEKPNEAASSTEWGASDEKRGWPWPQPGSTS